MSQEITFKSSYFLRALEGDYNPLTPNILTINDKMVSFSKRNWHLISVDTENLHFQNITGITIDKHLFGASLEFKSTGADPIIVHGFWKKEANNIRDLCNTLIEATYERKTIYSNLSGEPGEDQGHSRNRYSIADELIKLKGLLDQGVLSQEEFELQKRKILDQL